MKPSSAIATWIGTSSILQWGLQVTISTFAITVPPYALMSMTFMIAFLVMAVIWVVRRENPFPFARYGPKVWVIGIGGQFGYYASFYFALNHAPAVEVALLINLWPLLMVLMSGLLPGERLGWHHLLGCLVGVAGSMVLLGPGAIAAFGGNHLLGQAAAIVAAFIWAAYSVLNRTLGAVPTGTVGWYCLALALLALACHLLFERPAADIAVSAWIAVIMLGIGPIGLALFAWDIGLKHGNLRLLGILSFFIPMISACALILAGRGQLDWRVGAATVLITGGALIAAKRELTALFGRASPQKSCAMSTSSS